MPRSAATTERSDERTRTADRFRRSRRCEAILREVTAKLRAGSVIPYLGTGVTELAKPGVPMNPKALAAFLGSKVALPRRARGNAWAAAQHIESTKHRSL